MQGGMSNASQQNVWVAAFLAIVLKVMALPMAGAFGALSIEQLLTGSFCSVGSVQQVTLALDKQQPSSAGKADQFHCCCSQTLEAVFIPPASVALIGAIAASPRPFTPPLFWVSPRARWPSINPRASPARHA
ncbi:hypothetical protein AB7M23_003135 [Pseudomonas sp. HLS-6 TE3448]